MRFLRASITILTLAATLLGGQTLYRCLMADAVTLSACHCPAPKDAGQPVLEGIEGDACCAGFALPSQLSAIAVHDGVAAQAPTAIIARLPRLERQPQLHADRSECRDSRALAPPIYKQFCRILI